MVHRLNLKCSDRAILAERRSQQKKSLSLPKVTSHGGDVGDDSWLKWYSTLLTVLRHSRILSTPETCIGNTRTLLQCNGNQGSTPFFAIFDDEEWRIITLFVNHLDSKFKYTDFLLPVVARLVTLWTSSKAMTAML